MVYAAFLPYAHHISRTMIQLDVPGDTYAPIPGDEWELDAGDWEKSENGLIYRFDTLTRADAR